MCRLVVLPSVPAASTEFERFAMAHLGDATFMRHRVGQRVTQALGQLAQEATSSRIRVVGCIVTRLEEVEDDAALAARDRLCLVHIDALSALLDFLGARLQTYADRWGGGSAAERGHAREEVESQLPSETWLADLFAPSGGRLVRREDVLRCLSLPPSRP